jgi:hypothetical protein
LLASLGGNFFSEEIYLKTMRYQALRGGVTDQPWLLRLLSTVKEIVN